MSRNWKNPDVTCNHCPTRPHLLKGLLLSDQKNNSLFINKDHKIIFKLFAKTNICGCKHVYTTNYKGLFLNPVPPCARIEEKQLPPSSLNLEFSENIKQDYAMFHTENITQFIYHTLYAGQTKVAESNLRNFLTLARKQNELGIFEIKRPLYGKLRGEVLSLMNCPSEKLKVMKHTSKCTKQIQVTNKNGTLWYVAIGSRLLQKQFEVTECHPPELGDIVAVEDIYGNEVFITQEEDTKVFQHISGHLNESETILSPKLIFLSLTQISSFYQSGLYDEKFLEKRRNYLFSGEVYSAIRTGITGAIFPKSRMDWEEAASGKIDFAQAIGINTLREIIDGSWIIRFIKSILEVLGYMSAVHMLRLILIYMTSCNVKDCSRSTLTCIRFPKNEVVCDEYDDSSSDNDSHTQG